MPRRNAVDMVVSQSSNGVVENNFSDEREEQEECYFPHQNMTGHKMERRSGFSSSDPLQQIKSYQAANLLQTTTNIELDSIMKELDDIDEETEVHHQLPFYRSQSTSSPSSPKTDETSMALKVALGRTCSQTQQHTSMNDQPPRNSRAA